MNPIRFIKKLYRWAVKSVQYSIVLWDDGDWDWASILKLLGYKIKRTREHIAKHDNHTTAQESVEQMRQAEESIKKIVDDDWLPEETEAHFVEYPLHIGVVGVENPHSDKDEIGKAKWRSLSARMQALEAAEWAALCENLRKNCRGWWD